MSIILNANTLKIEEEKEIESILLRDSNNCHVSFGNQQKESLAGMFIGFREECSNQPSK